MSKIKLISAITRGKWLIDEQYAAGFMPIVADFLKGKPVAWFDDEEDAHYSPACYILEPAGDSFIRKEFSEIIKEPGAVAILSLDGPVMKEDWCGSIGTASLRRHLRIAAATPNIASIVFIGNSGGGSVDGTFELADEINEVQAIKPVIGFIDGRSCSAMYAIHSACTAIYACHRTAEVGSIGVCVELRDYREYMLKQGIKEIYINAETSPDKNQDFIQARDGKVELMQKNSLVPLHAIFKETVKRGRGERLKSDDTLTGTVYLAELAIENGIIDGILSFEDCVNEAYELGINQSK
jgi:protease IV